mmetsp:Transcript_5791/g.13639  ORF Transcript_5791/g.13639 Transcript_5791/m.13639 type:complete len:191 (+) Transcript_5791:102-674(+)|eukprot:CAMPEP_0171069616 /NCGR_PEP_ID=MMETSP0766_2-20121228/9252_1 /TAXON_ID=439317 /ORGANISM="Gambierdiscus australes, Strain CAWD 149" /LENGTH=190 /DNA_ID=CAMNT_0011526009 /DNA_START=15 /DNA_END=587 /DNA_ORIENTATION=-
MGSSSLPSLITDAEHFRLMRRLEHNARAREKASRLEGTLSVTMGAAKEANKNSRSQLISDMHRAQQERVDRWVHKTQGSPLLADLWAEDQKVFELNRSRNKHERIHKKRADKLQREAHQSIYNRVMAEEDELEILRGEKRLLVENEKQLKALRDVEKTNGRCAKVLAARKSREMERQQHQLERALSVPTF